MNNSKEKFVAPTGTKPTNHSHEGSAKATMLLIAVLTLNGQTVITEKGCSITAG